MTLKQIDSFRAVYQLQNVSQAAQSIFLSPQAVSKNLQHLEEELDVVLFERSPRGMKPTLYADYLYEESNQLAEVLTRIVSNIQQMSQVATEISVGIGYSVLPFLGTSLLRDYEAAHPEIKVRVTDRLDLELEDLLMQDQLQLILSVGPLDAKKFYVYPLKSDTMCICLQPSHPLYNKEEVTLRDLEDQAIIVCGDQFRIYYEWERYCRSKKLHFRNTITFTEHWAFLQLMEHMELAWIAPTHTAKVSFPGIRMVEIPDLRWQVVLATRRGRCLAEPVQALIRSVVAQFAMPK